MKLIHNITYIFLLAFAGFSANAQEIVTEYIDVYQGTSKNIQVSSAGATPQVVNQPLEGNEVVRQGNNGNDHIFVYTPAEDFLGSDGFSIETYVSIFPPEIITYNIVVNVIASMVSTSDDFARIDSSDIEINVLSNDETSSNDLTVSIAHVMYGTASVGEDNIITYTPIEGVDEDFVVYNVVDQFGTSSSATIYLSKEIETNSDISDSFSIPSGSVQYITVPAADYSLDSSSLEFGTLNQVDDFVYAYTANQQVNGIDSISFTDGAFAYQAIITVIEKYIDDGFVKDDVFHTAPNTQFVFNVKENDLTNGHVITEYSDELYFMGDGEFAYTPPVNFSGVKTFYYTGDNGFAEENGKIELFINAYNPVNEETYSFTGIKNKSRSIEYEVPLGTEYLEIAAYPENGNLELFSEDESIDLECIEGLQKLIAVYTPDNNFVGEDEFAIRYCASGNNLCETVNITLDVRDNDTDACICVDDCVWEGDANADGKVSILDILAVGRNIGNAGPARAASEFGEDYAGVTVPDWNNNQVNGQNLKHADTNGDGLISIADITPIVNNYGETNSIISDDILGVRNIPLYYSGFSPFVEPGDLVTLDVILGTSNNPVINLNGISFATQFSSDFVDSASVNVEFYTDSYFAKGAPFTSYAFQPTDGTIHSAGVKTNNLTSTGAGIIASVSFIVEEVAEGLKEVERRSTAYGNDAVITVTLDDIIIEDGQGNKFQLPSSSIELVVKNESSQNENSFVAYPNPVSNTLSIKSSDQKLSSISISDISGKVMMSNQFVNAFSQDFDLSELSNGLYIVTITGEEKTEIKKIVKR